MYQKKQKKTSERLNFCSLCANILLLLKGECYMQTFKVDLYDYFGIKRRQNASGYLTAFIAQPNDFNLNRVRPAMLIIPGGGYRYVSNAESDTIAFEYLSKGYCAFVLDYSIAPASYPTQLLEACMAMIYIRENLNEFHICEDMVGAIGFSAGGHLCGCLATIWNEKEIVNILGEKAKLARPDAVVLAYPVVSMDESIAHIGSRNNVTGGNADLVERLSLENRVDKNSVPAFIWATLGDGTVPCENSMRLAMAYKKAGVPFEFHLFERGRHGLALVNRETEKEVYPAKEWVQMSHTWLKEKGFDLID